MADMEKVIKGLECCTNISPDGCLMLCPYKDEKDETYSGFCEQVLKQDALALLKEQEAVKPIHKCWNGRFTQLNRVNGYAFCPYCGKPIDWGKNVLL